jgi:hypothetical protein
MEKNIVEQISSDQWKLARLERYEARLFDDNIPNPNDFAKPSIPFTWAATASSAPSPTPSATSDATASSATIATNS